MTRSTDFEYDIQFDDLKRTVWVHCSDGSTVGRFGPAGIDIHRPISEQLEGKGQCLYCTHSFSTTGDWDVFREKAQALWGVDIPPDAIDASMLAEGPPSEGHGHA